METADSSIMNMAMPMGGGNPDDILLVKFTIEPQKNVTRSLEEGRPIFEDKEWISIMAPGSRNEVRREARMQDKDRFPRHYAAFKNRQDQQVNEGTPLSEWPGATRSQVEEMKFWNIVTVEQLAGVADSTMGQVRGLVTLKQSAIKYLDASKGNAAAEQLAEQKAINAKLMERLEALENTEQPMVLDDLEPPPKKRRRRAATPE